MLKLRTYWKPLTPLAQPNIVLIGDWENSEITDADSFALALNLYDATISDFKIEENRLSAVLNDPNLSVAYGFNLVDLPITKIEKLDVRTSNLYISECPLVEFNPLGGFFKFRDTTN